LEKGNKFGVKVYQSKLKNGENFEGKRTKVRTIGESVANRMMPPPRELIRSTYRPRNLMETTSEKDAKVGWKAHKKFLPKLNKQQKERVCHLANGVELVCIARKLL